MCSDFKNNLSWKDVSRIRLHLMIRDFAKDYTVWIYQGKAVVDVELKEEFDDAVDEDESA